MTAALVCPRCHADARPVTVRHGNGRATVTTVCPAGHSVRQPVAPRPLTIVRGLEQR